MGWVQDLVLDEAGVKWRVRARLSEAVDNHKVWSDEAGGGVDRYRWIRGVVEDRAVATWLARGVGSPPNHESAALRARLYYATHFILFLVGENNKIKAWERWCCILTYKRARVPGPAQLARLTGYANTDNTSQNRQIKQCPFAILSADLYP